MAEKKKILYIVEAMGGGVFTYIVDLANELVNKYDMYIAYAVRKQTPKNYKDYFDKRIHLIEVKNFRRAIDPMKDIAAFFEVKKIAAEIKPDIIHLHSSKAGAIGRMAFNGKIPMFYTPHGYSFLMENYKPMKRRMFKLIESVCAKRNCTTISCSVGEHQESLKLTKHATYVNNGINMAELQEIIDKTEKVEHSFTVYTLGRICYQKNPTLFNEIAESLPDVKFVWIGDGELRDQLTSENIEITGWADRSTAIRYAVNADVFLLPSRWEGLPISLLESMYMKKACVVSNVIGNRDVIHKKQDCCGCTACAAICPKDAIIMKEDNEGFLYPTVDKENCIDCGACERVCPIIHTAKEKPFEQAAYIVQNKDQKVLRESTAGGAFTAIAKYVLHNNGVVVGVELGADLTARHVAVEKENDLYRFRNSKYVQSSVGGVPTDRLSPS